MNLNTCETSVSRACVLTNCDVLVMMCTQDEWTRSIPQQGFYDYVSPFVYFDRTTVFQFSGKMSTHEWTYCIAASDADGSVRKVPLLLVGLGEESDAGTRLHTRAREVCANSLDVCREKSFVRAVFHVRSSSLPVSDAVHTISLTVALTNTPFDMYLSTPKTRMQSVCVYVSDANADVDALCAVSERAHFDGAGTVLAQHIANVRGDDGTPSRVEAIARDIADKYGMRLTCIEGPDVLDAGLRLLHAVGRGARDGPRLVAIEYRGRPETKGTVAVVGKGVTFDSGGLNLKPTGSIETMHLDKGGAAAVLGMMNALGLRRARVNVVGVIALAENAIGADAYHPHSIIRSRKGTTVRVANTDAEGRLVLADAIDWAQDRFKPHTVIDLATLTGACVGALGEYIAGLFSNDDALAASLCAAGNAVHERCWRLPILDEHRSELKCDEADLNSMGGKYGGAITAAAFLEHFVHPGVRWAHIDIAGPAMASTSRAWIPRGGTGFGVQLLLKFIDPEL